MRDYKKGETKTTISLCMQTLISKTELLLIVTRVCSNLCAPPHTDDNSYFARNRPGMLKFGGFSKVEYASN